MLPRPTIAIGKVKKEKVDFKYFPRNMPAMQPGLYPYMPTYMESQKTCWSQLSDFLLETKFNTINYTCKLYRKLFPEYATKEDIQNMLLSATVKYQNSHLSMVNNNATRMCDFNRKLDEIKKIIITPNAEVTSLPRFNNETQTEVQPNELKKRNTEPNPPEYKVIEETGMEPMSDGEPESPVGSYSTDGSESSDGEWGYLNKKSN